MKPETLIGILLSALVAILTMGVILIVVRGCQAL